jgi:DNA-binding CsgD family transcriptional regulator
VRVLDVDGMLAAADALTLGVCTGSEQGLLGAAADPAFASNGYVYLFYSRSAGGCANRVSRFTMTGNSLGGEQIELSGAQFGMISLVSTYAVGRAMQLTITPERTIDHIELTPRERECLKWAAVGKSEWEISQILGISEHTSEKHLLNAKSKLGAVNRVQAVAEAIRRCYIS